ncbi:CDP-Glycerol:Poly(glycerophosphate) glycerophosphotransferase [Butyrivibrio sp. ob235]|uniref:CDP-glycerol glycerophosphotransferase family protein n=1 Tax=Butyrivibrio sp. ob235 TaxID=1761780 RepID=UPI0008BB92D0|nr:CDP-glycerol glycerophosphotransferase family protein [Butyrivibrio sp. ob235]SEL97152.1 CDP-Glycerol:Poly(glycerophosphate) glycerophosphotransferase [Butyrivibrio sp. ob235]
MLNGALYYKDERLQCRIIDESQADDFYEILAGMDAYITDYSSAVFEAGFAKIPSFIYADDISKYSNDRGSLYWNLTTDPHDHVTNNKAAHPDMDLIFPFPIATNNNEMDSIEVVTKLDLMSFMKK